jgi:hypothetical protein
MHAMHRPRALECASIYDTSVRGVEMSPINDARRGCAPFRKILVAKRFLLVRTRVLSHKFVEEFAA